MGASHVSSKSIRRILLTILAVGAAGPAVGGSEASANVFARHFLDRGVQMNVPKMVYDPQLQMMVDPDTKQAIYNRNKQMKLAKVTAGCDDCPKYDD